MYVNRMLSLNIILRDSPPCALAITLLSLDLALAFIFDVHLHVRTKSSCALRLKCLYKPAIWSQRMCVAGWYYVQKASWSMTFLI